ncbi:MAG: hypothetical protein CME19_18135 [Gemmatimonadetes bacterium]|nr:hypothetical protein [Gemmatimonadota bacterium]
MKTMSIVIAAISLAVLVRNTYYVRSGRMSFRQALIWFVIWVSVGYGALNPSVLDRFLSLVAMEDRMVFLFVVSNLVLFVLTYYLYVGQKRSERTIARLVQELSLVRYDLESQRKREVAASGTDESG